jgi:flagellar motor component MotA
MGIYIILAVKCIASGYVMRNENVKMAIDPGSFSIIRSEVE